jgi:hypothetical protein
MYDIRLIELNPTREKVSGGTLRRISCRCSHMHVIIHIGDRGDDPDQGCDVFAGAQLARGNTDYAMLEIVPLFQCPLEGRQPVAYKAKLKVRGEKPRSRNTVVRFEWGDSCAA